MAAQTQRSTAKPFYCQHLVAQKAQSTKSLLIFGEEYNKRIKMIAISELSFINVTKIALFPDNRFKIGTSNSESA